MPEIKQAIITDVREVIKKDSSGKPIGANNFLSITVLTDYQIWVSAEFAQLYIQHLGEKCFINVEESMRNGQKSLNLVNGGSPVFMPSVPSVQQVNEISKPAMPNMTGKPVVPEKSATA